MALEVKDFTLIPDVYGDVLLMCPEHDKIAEVNNMQEAVDAMTNHLIKESHHER